MVRTIRQVICKWLDHVEFSAMLAKLPKNAWIVKLRNENCPIAGGIPALQRRTTVGLELRHRCIDFTGSVKGSSGSKPPKNRGIKFVRCLRIWSMLRSFRTTLGTSAVLRDGGLYTSCGWTSWWLGFCWRCGFLGRDLQPSDVFCWQKAPVHQRWFHSGWWIYKSTWDGYIKWSHDIPWYKNIGFQ